MRCASALAFVVRHWPLCFGVSCCEMRSELHWQASAPSGQSLASRPKASLQNALTGAMASPTKNKKRDLCADSSPEAGANADHPPEQKSKENEKVTGQGEACQGEGGEGREQDSKNCEADAPAEQGQDRRSIVSLCSDPSRDGPDLQISQRALR